MLACFAVVGVGIFSSGTPTEQRAWANTLTWWAAAASLGMLILLLSATVHELGHLVASLLAGFRVDGLRVWPLEVARTPGGWRVSVSLGRGIGFGHVETYPLTLDHLRARHAFIIAAGPGAQLVMGVAVAFVALARHNSLLGLSAVFVVVVPLLNIAPWRPGSGQQLWRDGQWLRGWVRDPERAAQRVAAGALELAARQGDRPREWDTPLVQLAARGPEQPRNLEQVLGSQWASLWALDSGDLVLAAASSDRAVAGCRLVTPSGRATLAAWRAFLAARYLGDAGAAERLLASESERTVTTVIDVGLAEAAIHLTRGRAAEAVETADRTLDLMPESGTLQRGVAVLMREQLEAVREMALKGFSSPPVRATGQ